MAQASVDFHPFLSMRRRRGGQQAPNPAEAGPIGQRLRSKSSGRRNAPGSWEGRHCRPRHRRMRMPGSRRIALGSIASTTSEAGIKAGLRQRVFPCFGSSGRTTRWCFRRRWCPESVGNLSEIILSRSRFQRVLFLSRAHGGRQKPDHRAGPARRRGRDAHRPTGRGGADVCSEFFRGVHQAFPSRNFNSYFRVSPSSIMVTSVLLMQ